MRANLRTLCFAIVSSLALFGIPENSSAVSFGTPTSYPVGTNPAAIVAGDFNGDGKIDIAVANTDSGDVSILLGNGDGTFQAAVNYSAGNSPTDIAVGDFNGDGKLDLAVLQPGVSVAILLGNGDGTFQAPKAIASTASSIEFMAVADFDGDKKTDLAVCDPSNLNIYISNGDGTFQAAKSTALSSGCRGLYTADFNNDSKPDLALITADLLTTGAIQILLGKGDGTFSTSGTVNVSGERRPIVMADLNHDGKVDLVVNTENLATCSPPPCNNPSTRAITVYLGNGDGTFQSGQVVASVSFFGPRGLRLDDPLVGDFNGDGKMDLAYLGSSSTSLVARFQLGKGDGSFSPPILDLPVSTGKGLIAQDLNGDKLADLITIGTANNIEVWLNASPISGTDLSVLTPSVSAGPYVVGTNVTFTADVINQGPQDATGVTFTDTLPNGVTFVSATATQGSCVQSHGIVSCTIGALASAFDSSVSIVAAPSAVGTIANTMSVTGAQSDPVPGNNSATQTLNIVPVFALTVTDSGKGSGTVTAGVGAINCGSTCTATYPQGTSVSLTATPAASSIFSAWSGACTGTDPNTCTILMNSAQSVTATFNLAPDFSLAAASASLALQTGAQGTDALTVTGQNAFSGQVNLTCAVNGTAPLATCGVSPSSVTVGSSPGTSTLTVTAPASLLAYALPRTRGISGAMLAVALPFPGVFLVVTGLISRGQGMRRIRLCFLGATLIAVFVVLAGCGGGTPPPPKNYTVTVTATSATGSVLHAASVNVTVN